MKDQRNAIVKRQKVYFLICHKIELNIIKHNFIYKKKMLIKHFNFNELNSQFIDTFEDDSYHDIDIPLDLTEKQLQDFNNRRVNVDNLNKVIEIFDYFNIDELEEFIILNFKDTKEIILNEGHNDKINPVTIKLLNKNKNIKDCDLDYVIKLDADIWLKMYADKSEVMKNKYFDLALKYFSYKCVKFYIERDIYYEKDVIINNTFEKISYFEEYNTSVNCYKLLKYFVDIGCMVTDLAKTHIYENKSTLCYLYLKDINIMKAKLRNKSFSYQWLDVQKPNLDFFKIFHSFTERVRSAEYSYSLKNRKFDCFYYIYEINLKHRKKHKLKLKADWTVDILADAVSSDNIDIVKLIYDSGVKINLDTFEYSLKNNNKEIFYYLYENSLKYPERTSFRYNLKFNFDTLKLAVQHEHLDIIKIILDKEYFESNLLASLKVTNLEILKLFIDNGMFITEDYVYGYFSLKNVDEKKCITILDYIFNSLNYKISLDLIQKSKYSEYKYLDSYDTFLYVSNESKYIEEYLIDNYNGNIENEKDMDYFYKINSNYEKEIFLKLIRKFKDKIKIASSSINYLIEHNEDSDVLNILNEVILNTSYNFDENNLKCSIKCKKYHVSEFLISQDPSIDLDYKEVFLPIFKTNDIKIFMILCNDKTDTFPFSDTMFIDCIKYCNVDFLKYLYFYCEKKMIPQYEKVFNKLWINNNVYSPTDELHKNVIYNCIKYNKFECFKFAIEKKSLFNKNIFKDLIKIKHDISQFIDYINEEDKQFVLNSLLRVKSVTSLLVEHGNLGFLKMLYNHGHRYDVTIANNLLENSHFECFKFVIDTHEIKDNESYCKNAVINGNLSQLKYAYECGCPLSPYLMKFVCSSSSRNLDKYKEIKKYLIEKKCPFDKDDLIEEKNCFFC